MTATAKETTVRLIDARHLELINYGMGYVPTERAVMDHPAVAAYWRAQVQAPEAQAPEAQAPEWPPMCPACKRSLGGNCAPGCREQIIL